MASAGSNDAQQAILIQLRALTPAQRQDMLTQAATAEADIKIR